MALWRIVAYVPEGQETPAFVDWYAAQNPKVQAEFEATLTTLVGEPDWDDPDVEEFKAFTGREAGLGEIRFEVEQQEGKKRLRRQLRVLGIWPADNREFVLLNGYEKSGRVTVPPGAPADAMRMRRQYGQGRGRIDEYK